MSPRTLEHPYVRDDLGRFAQPADTLLERDELFTLWSVAAAEANLAFEAWRADPCRDAYLVFRAAEDQADAAQDALAALAD